MHLGIPTWSGGYVGLSTRTRTYHFSSRPDYNTKMIDIVGTLLAHCGTDFAYNHDFPVFGFVDSICLFCWGRGVPGIIHHHEPRFLGGLLAQNGRIPALTGPKSARLKLDGPHFCLVAELKSQFTHHHHGLASLIHALGQKISLSLLRTLPTLRPQWSNLPQSVFAHPMMIKRVSIPLIPILVCVWGWGWGGRSLPHFSSPSRCHALKGTN